MHEVPGNYARLSTEKPRRIYDAKPGLDCEPNCRDLQAKRTEESPLVARFGSQDPPADMSVSVRGANTLKLTFLQIKDVTEFGDVVEATNLFVPPGAELLSSSSRRETQFNTAGEDNLSRRPPQLIDNNKNMISIVYPVHPTTALDLRETGGGLN